MRMDLNLASEPFRNRSLFWLGMGAAYLIAVVVLLTVLWRAGEVGAGRDELQLQIAEQEATILDLEQRVAEVEKAESEMVFQPSERQALDDARSLINRKAFSWSRLLGDLEGFVPKGAKVTSISIVGIEGEGPNRVVSLQVLGVGKTFGQMAEMIGALDRSGGRFAAEPVENGQAGDSPEFNFTIDVRYRPGVGTATPVAPEQAKEGDDA